MRLATVLTPHGTRAVRVDGGSGIDCGFDDVGSLLEDPDWLRIAGAAKGTAYNLSKVRLAPVVPRPGKIICVGLNYKSHILEMGRELPEYPTLFAKYPEVLIVPYDPLVLSEISTAVDWEAELAIIIGRPVHRVDEVKAQAAIAGYAVFNDVTMRDWQFRTREWFQGKNFEATAPFGPHLVTPDELAPDARIECRVDDEVVQSARINDLVFPPASLVAYVSTILTLSPGDVIATGTPGGVGHARDPQRYLRPGQTLSTTIQGIGTMQNRVLKEENHG
jgi:acylpyruvate hydrolase